MLSVPLVGAALIAACADATLAEGRDVCIRAINRTDLNILAGCTFPVTPRLDDGIWMLICMLCDEVAAERVQGCPGGFFMQGLHFMQDSCAAQCAFLVNCMLVDETCLIQHC